MKTFNILQIKCHYKDSRKTYDRLQWRGNLNMYKWENLEKPILGPMGHKLINIHDKIFKTNTPLKLEDRC